MLGGLGAQLVTPDDLGLAVVVTEDGQTYRENAVKKAIAFANLSGLISLADDSGLEVGALRGAPGIRSARYLAIPDATDADRRAFLLQNLAGKRRPWRASFHSAVAVAVPHGGVEAVDGECAGQIIPEERGKGGFGYDAIFLLDEAGRTMAELDMQQKNRLSHRARAISKALTILERLFSTDSN